MYNLFINERHLNDLISIFKNYCPNAEIWAYGSRVGGDAHEGSDLDLAVKHFGDKNCHLSELRKILQNSNIPFLIDIFEFDNLPDSFKAGIEKKHIVIFPAEKS